MGKWRDRLDAGDAVWVVPRHDVVTPPARRTAREVIGIEALRAACEQAIADFAQPGGPYQDADALAQARQIIAGIAEQ